MFRLGCLRFLAATLLVCLVAVLSAVAPANQSAPAGPGSQPAQPQPNPPQQKNNPFETVPQSCRALLHPRQPRYPAKPPEHAQAGSGSTAAFEDVIESIEFRGARRVPQDTLRAMIFTKKGDKYDEESIHRDFMALWNTGRFDDIRMEREAGQNRLDSALRHGRAPRDPLHQVRRQSSRSPVSEILDRFKERKVGLSVESQYDPNKVQRARNVLQEYLAERGRQFATVEPDMQPGSASRSK